MRKQLERELAEMVATLPVKYKTVTKTVKGAKFIRLNFKKDNEGKKIDPKANYTLKEQVKVDHLEEVKKIFLKSGIDAVAAYCSGLFEQKGQTLLSDRIAEMKLATADLSDVIQSNKTQNNDDEISIEITGAGRIALHPTVTGETRPKD